MEDVESVKRELTVPQRLGTMKSFGSLSVNVMRLRGRSVIHSTCAMYILMYGWREGVILHRRFRDRYSPSVEVFLQPLVQLRKPSKLQFCH